MPSEPVHYIVEADSLTSVANAIRAKGGTSNTLEFPTGFVSAIQNLPTGAGGDYIRSTVCPQQTFTGAGAGTSVALADTMRLVDGDDYIITYDNVEYACTSVELWGTDRFLGNIPLSWGSTSTDIIFPFCVEDWNSNPGLEVYAMDTSQHSIKIEHLELLTGGTTLVQKTITANGTYDPEDDSADGYSEVTVALPSGTAGTPTATKGSVNNHSVSVTPSVTNTAGVISGGTINGTPVTVSASELVSGSETKTANGTYDVTNLASLVIDVPAAASGIGTLLTTYSMGSISTSSTSATDTGKSISVSGVNDYDLLIVETSVNSVTNNRHTATTRLILLTASSTVGTKNGATIATATWNSKISSSAVTTTRANTTAYGVYPNSCTVSDGTATLAMYQRYNSTQTGTINGTYTTRVYGIKLYDLIGG